jgi:ATP-dependent helicase/nuclease subunit B
VEIVTEIKDAALIEPQFPTMASIGKRHAATRSWSVVMGKLRGLLAQRKVHPAQLVVLLPYAQLIHEARRAWTASGEVSAAAAAFFPRFESTLNWANALGGFAPKGDDLRLDAAFDAITARSLLQRAGLPGQSVQLAPQLMEAAWSLAALAAAVDPAQRTAWGEALAQTLFAGLAEPALSYEAALGRIALAWASTSSYATDVLFHAEPELLVVVDGFQTEPLLDALALRLGSRCVRLPFDEALAGQFPEAAIDGPGIGQEEGNDGGQDPDQEDRQKDGQEGATRLHAATDFEDEAERAAACVVRQLALHTQADSQVGLVALDRLLIRRVRAMLGDRGIRIRDETGWKLSTTRAAAGVMALLRASQWSASTDEVLNWLKNAPGFAPTSGAVPGIANAVDSLERELRKLGQRDWPLAPDNTAALTETSRQLIQVINALRERLKASRKLSQWLADLRAVLQDAGQWTPLMADAAGRAVLDALGMPTALGTGGDSAGNQAALDAFPGYAMRLNASEMAAWAAQALEAANFSPPHPPEAQVVILPMAQLLGRSLDAVVLAGCDETRLQASPDPQGLWTPAQRVMLGLPSRVDMAQAMRKSWQCALASPQIDILWRTGEGAERCLPSDFVQTLVHQAKQRQLAALAGSPAGSHGHAEHAEPSVYANDPRTVTMLDANPAHMPQPTGQALPVRRLSASGYEDLRRCPYRFFALRQLKLNEADELDTEVDKRDFGNWLHRLLFHFQQALRAHAGADRAAQERLINAAAEQASAELGLSPAEFLPFSAAWPRVRAGYLDWLAGHLASGQVFAQGEAWKELQLGPVTLVGKLDRLDRSPDGKPMVIDYKTESRSRTTERILAGNEDTQLAFYAALIDVDDIAAAYVNVGEKEETKTYLQPDIVAMRGQLAEGILEDLQGIASGKAMPAMGEGLACEFCAARGLCRKDFWSGNSVMLPSA